MDLRLEEMVRMFVLAGDDPKVAEGRAAAILAEEYEAGWSAGYAHAQQDLEEQWAKVSDRPLIDRRTP